MTLTFAMVVMVTEGDNASKEKKELVSFLLLSAAYYATVAMEMVVLDSRLMDILPQEEVDAGYYMELQNITLDSYSGDDECSSKTRFNKASIRAIVEKLDLGATIRVYYNPMKYYKFAVETLVIYMMRKMSTARTHVDLADSEFGGCPKRWGAGYNCIVHKFDRRFKSLIGPSGLRAWAPKFPYFAEVIRQYLCRPKARVTNTGDPRIKGLTVGYVPPNEFNVFSFTDCSFYEICRPGSGPKNNDIGSGRRDDWYEKQRAFYCGYQRGMEACVKLLTIMLPNGITAALYGPTSGRSEDKALFRLAEFDDYIHDLCEEFHNSRLYATYGDGIFGGYWYCLRSCHVASTNMPLTDVQDDQNKNMTSARQSVELSYAKAEQLWPLLNRKDSFKLDLNPARCFAEMRVMYLLTNFCICAQEGSTMTGTRGFCCPPPSLSEYLDMASQEEELDIDANYFNCL